MTPPLTVNWSRSPRDEVSRNLPIVILWIRNFPVALSYLSVMFGYCLHKVLTEYEQGKFPLGKERRSRSQYSHTDTFTFDLNLVFDYRADGVDGPPEMERS